MSSRSLLLTLLLFAAHLLSLGAVIAFGVMVVCPLYGAAFAVFVGIFAAMAVAAKIEAVQQRVVENE